MTNALLFGLLLSINWARLRTAARRWFDAFDRWASRRWPVTPKGRDEDGRLVEYQPRPEWDTTVTVDLGTLIRNPWPVGDVT